MERRIMDKQRLEEFFGLCNQYNPFHGFGSESGSSAANDIIGQLREMLDEHPELKAVDRAFFAYWYKGDEKPTMEDFL
jgi:hypothetical protein